MKAECKLEHQSPQATLSIRFRAPAQQLSEHFSRAYGAVAAYLAEMKLSPSGPAFATYHNLDMSNLDVEAGFAVDHSLPGRGEIRAGEMAECDAATSIHTGPYDGVGATYAALTEWIHAHGLTSAGLPSEFYLNDPTSTPAANLRTKVVLPVQPA